eukprot:jgi/Mesen1/6527/ME000333S05840
MPPAVPFWKKASSARVWLAAEGPTKVQQQHAKYSWRPAGGRNCQLAPFDAHVMLSGLRNKRIVFAGDSIMRQMFQSLLCMLDLAKTPSSPTPSDGGASTDELSGQLAPRQPQERFGRAINKEGKRFEFLFPSYNATFVYIHSPFLARVESARAPGSLWARLPADAGRATAVDIDAPDDSWAEYVAGKGADTVVLNTGLWYSDYMRTQYGIRFYSSRGSGAPNASSSSNASSESSNSSSSFDSFESFNSPESNSSNRSSTSGSSDSFDADASDASVSSSSSLSEMTYVRALERALLTVRQAVESSPALEHVPIFFLGLSHVHFISKGDGKGGEGGVAADRESGAEPFGEEGVSGGGAAGAASEDFNYQDVKSSAWSRQGECAFVHSPLTDAGLLPDRDPRAAEIERSLGSSGRIKVLKVSELTRSRADAHVGPLPLGRSKLLSNADVSRDLTGNRGQDFGLPGKSGQLADEKRTGSEDCVHFCLPGVPDAWNEVFYHELLALGTI